jgi:hypothetical protein
VAAVKAYDQLDVGPPHLRRAERPWMATVEGVKLAKRIGRFVSLLGCLMVVLSGFRVLWLIASSKKHDGWLVLQFVSAGIFFVGWLLQRSTKQPNVGRQM